MDDFVGRKASHELKAIDVLCIHAPQQTVFVENLQKAMTWSRSMTPGPDLLSQCHEWQGVVSEEIKIKDALGRRQIEFL